MIYEVRFVIEAPDSYTSEDVLSMVSRNGTSLLKEHIAECSLYGIGDKTDSGYEPDEVTGLKGYPDGNGERW